MSEREQAWPSAKSTHHALRVKRFVVGISARLRKSRMSVKRLLSRSIRHFSTLEQRRHQTPQHSWVQQKLALLLAFAPSLSNYSSRTSMDYCRRATEIAPLA
jgi:hypothetical protein